MELPKKIDKLLRSSNIDDVEIGVVQAYKTMGEKWCHKNFDFHAEGAVGNEGNYITKNRLKETRLIIINSMKIYIGPRTIEANVPGDRNYLSYGDRTKSTYKI
jgi:hypothetical protein